MAAIMLTDGNTQSPEILNVIYKKCEHSLPSYARPLFLRFKDTFEITSTMKHRKVDLVKEGYDPERITDKLYFIDEKNKTYSALNTHTYQTVLQSRL